MKLKVCGITMLEQLQQLQRLDVDYAGLIFYEKSKRYADEKLKASNEKIKTLQIKKVGVFVNASIEYLLRMTDDYDLSAVQLHGDETPEFCALLCDAFSQTERKRKETKIIKAIRVGARMIDTNDITVDYQSTCDYFLFDTDTATYGGSGKRFDWTILQKSTINKPFFLSGGITPEDMGNLKSFKHPFFYGIDINSRFELSPGIKDMNLVEPFVNAFKLHSYG